MTDTEITLRYGMNPHQTPARAFVEHGTLPFEVRNGSPGFINLLDAQRASFAANERLINAKRDYLVAAVNTFRAMGVPPALFEVEED